MNISTTTVSGKTKVKIVFLGDQSVGKTSIIQRFVNDSFDSNSHPTVGIDFLVKNISHKQKNYRLQLWDTAGQQRFKSLVPNYIKDSQICFVVFDVTDKTSLNSSESWLDMYKEHNQEGNFCFLIGNKIDMEEQRQLTIEECQEKAKSLNVTYFEVSAKTGANIDILFSNLFDIFAENQMDPDKFKVDSASKKNDSGSKGLTNNPSIKLGSNKLSSNKPEIHSKTCC